MLPFLVCLYCIWIIIGKFNFACLRIAAFLLCSCRVSALLLFVLVDLFVGTYRLSSHARLEAFVFQT